MVERIEHAVSAAKSSVHEGGITTPLVVRHWPRGIAARGELRHNPGHLIDLAPTILELAGGRWPTTFAGKPMPRSPGKSLVPVFTKDGTVVHDYFWWYHIGNRAAAYGGLEDRHRSCESVGALRSAHRPLGIEQPGRKNAG